MTRRPATTSRRRTAKAPLRVGVVDFFCGCGGVSTGFKLASVPGVEVHLLAGIDNDKHACSTYKRMLGVEAECVDAHTFLDIPGTLRAAARRWHIADCDRLVLVGCSPCQGFAAHRQSVQEEDLRRNLFVVFSEIATRLKPDAILMENVPDLFSRRHWPFYERARKNLEKAGYNVRAKAYNFAAFGLPQERFRAVMMAMRQPFPMPEGQLAPDKFRTVRDTIGHLPPLRSGETDATDPMHTVSSHRPSTIRILEQVAKDGGNRPIGVGPKCLDRARERHGGYTDVYGRMSWDKPSVTLTGKCRTPSAGRYAHPEQNRGLSVREAALLQGFPSNYMFEGTFDSLFLQIGNAVPPLVARVMAEHILGLLVQEQPLLAELDRANDIDRPVGPGFAVTINGIKRKNVRKEPVEA